MRDSLKRILYNNENNKPAATCLNLTDLMLTERSQEKGHHAKLVYGDDRDQRNSHLWRNTD